jgi:predicted HicB family RNase H-like nuclease
MMEYKGYYGDVVYDAEAKLFHGDVINTSDVITFQGNSVEEIDQAFHESVDDYLDWCQQDGVEPSKPLTGNIKVHLPVDLELKVVLAARRQHMSINRFIQKTISNKVASII